MKTVVVGVLGFYVSPTAKVIRKWDLGLKSHPKDWRSPRSNSRPQGKKASGLTTTLPWLLTKTVYFAETIAASDLKVGRCRQLIEFMKVCEY